LIVSSLISEFEDQLRRAVERRNLCQIPMALENFVEAVHVFMNSPLTGDEQKKETLRRVVQVLGWSGSMLHAHRALIEQECQSLQKANGFLNQMRTAVAPNFRVDF
jgi:hypothetical protein